MKTIVRIFTLLFLLVMHKTVFTQAGGVTFIPGSEWTWTAETKLLADWNINSNTFQISPEIILENRSYFEVKR